MENNEKKNYLKRIIGLPGEKLEIRAGLIYIIMFCRVLGK
ncbi:hypothetical protein GCWU000282_00680 [Catonella morbi ATCC 51271]|uniref:signal peptidase I n=1 Tax=Catonella morbi ATCC 51271 TaxID=592026 RepID=V2ZBN2_9FIRM|nr:S26 family signal peptidase [Catonella morbi]ESL04330.1 hypothetical protein GCWU000282_00680 [Catonella morbi ATCC 51271]